MDLKSDIREFLTSRRARISPEDVQLPIFRGRRRVPGLRREEVALLAGISVEYYTRLERGNVEGVSQDVIEAVARALNLDEAERAHLFNLIRTASLTGPAAARRRPGQERVRPTVQQIIDLIDAPAYVRNGRLDILAANALGRALYAPMFEVYGAAIPNLARFIFLDHGATELFPNWTQIANDAVGILRAHAGNYPYDRRLSDLVGELSTRSAEFRVMWAAQNVKFHRSGTKQLLHPVVGPLTLSFEAFDLAGDEGLRVNVYIAEPNSRSEDGLKLLGSWAATTA